MSFSNNSVLRCLCIEDCQVGKAPHSGFFSNDLLPSLGANSNRSVALRTYIISPFDRRYRAWEMFLVILVIYSAWISPFDFAFLDDKEGGLRIFDNIVNGFFAADIILTFFVAYLETQSYVLIDNHKKITMRYLSTWFIFDVSSTVPFRSLSLLCKDKDSEIGFQILSMLRLWRLRRVSSLFARLEKDIRFNYFWIRCTKLISVTLFAIHCAGCFNYMIADRYPDPNKTWIGAVYPNFKDESILNCLPKAIRASISRHLFYPIVRNVHLFRGISHECLFQLVSEMEVEYFPPKEVVILQNEIPANLYIIVTGAVDITSQKDGQNQIIGKIVSGEMFGETGVLYNTPQPFTFQTSEISQILRMDGSALLRIIHTNTQDGFIIMNNFYMKLKGLESFRHVGLTMENFSAEEGQTALHVAVKKGHLEMVRLLLEGGANVKKPDINGCTPISLATTNRDPCCSTSLTEPASMSSSSASWYPDREVKKRMKRVTIHANFKNMSEKQLPKFIVLTRCFLPSSPLTCATAGEKFGGQNFAKVVSSESAEVDDLNVIRDGDHLFFLPNDCDCRDCNVTQVEIERT